MTKKHLMIILLASLTMILAASSMCYANSYSFKGSCSYDGKKITSDFSSDEWAAAQARLQPGDSLTYTVTYKNNSNETTEWYMRNEVLQTLEQAKDAAENGGYTYVLQNEGPNGGKTTLFSNEKVGGEQAPGSSAPPDLEGLLQATNATKEFFFIQELKKGQSGKTHLKVVCDGETEVNDYQDTEAKDKKKVKTVVSHVKTGDDSQILLFAALMAAALIAAAIALILWRRDRKKDEEKGGEAA